MQIDNSTLGAVTAVYTEQRIPRFKNNPLIAALPPALDDDALADYLFDLPELNHEQRDWPAYERLHLIAGLESFMQPLERHVRLARALDTMIRTGYVGRVPRTAEHTRTFQKLYEAQQAGKAFNKQGSTVELQSSHALVGVSGQGKTTTVKRVFARFPQAIYHEGLNVTQIPYLHIEAPHDGISVKGLVHSILRKVDRIIPDADYYGRYGKLKTSSGETLLNHCARVMHMHCVGLLVVDEIQNLTHAGTGEQKLMSALVSASNELGVPILFIGTNKATNILGLDFRQARRGVGGGFSDWGPLRASGNLEEPEEWEDFLKTLWSFQWVKCAVPLNQHLANLMYRYSQGIIDIAIKLFACAQWRVILDQTETITAQTLESVWSHELSLVHPMLEALRSGDMSSLKAFGDIAPIDFSGLFGQTLNRYEGVRQKNASLRPVDSNFVPLISSVLVQAGVNLECAESLATEVKKDAKTTGVLEAVSAAIKLTKLPRSPRSKGAKPDECSAPRASEDYRNAIELAQVEGGTIFDKLDRMGAVFNIESIVDAD